MSEMIDRLARALYESQKFKRPWDHKRTQKLWKPVMERYARAALAEMREPTDDVWKALCTAISLGRGTTECWMAAIDAALR